MFELEQVADVSCITVNGNEKMFRNLHVKLFFFVNVHINAHTYQSKYKSQYYQLTGGTENKNNKN